MGISQFPGRASDENFKIGQGYLGRRGSLSSIPFGQASPGSKENLVWKHGTLELTQPSDLS